MRFALLVLLFAAACGNPSSSTSGKPVGPGNTPGPNPVISWTDDAGSVLFSWENLPAVTADGANIIVPVIDEDGGRGFPNLTLVVHDRADAVVHTQVVLALAEQEPVPPTQEAMDQANAYLAEINQQRDLYPMPKVENPRDDDGEYAESITADGVEVAWREGHVAISVAGALVKEADHQDWTVQPYQMCDDCEEMCENPSFLEAVHVDAKRKLALLHVGYMGNDSCWEPASQYHVVAWE